MYDVVALGELLIDFTPAGLSENGNVLFERNPGGAPANVLATLAKLGKKAAFIGMVGNDQFGEFLKGVLEDINIDTSGLVFSKEVNTTLAFVHLNDKGDRSFSFYRKPGADMMLEEKDVNFDLIKNARIFHFGSVSMTNEPSRYTTIKAARYAKENGILVSYDPNLRQPLWDSLSQAKEVISEGLKFADVLKISEEELTFLTGISDLEVGPKYLMQQYGNIQFMLISLGSKGCFYRVRDNTGCMSTYDVQTIDTTGAGDAFLGGILYQIIEKKKELAEFTVKDIQEIVDFANATGSLTTTKKGAIPAIPSLDEVYKCIRSIQKLKEE